MALLAELAALRPSWSFEIVGGLEGRRRVARLPRLPNLVFRGERPHGEMPDFRARFDVEIIPFRLSALTHATDPVKLYEAAAAGRSGRRDADASRSSRSRSAASCASAASAREFARQIEAAAAEGAAGARGASAPSRGKTRGTSAPGRSTAWLTEARGRDNREP